MEENSYISSEEDGESEEEMEIEEETQSASKKGEAEVGIIEEIRLFDFMCHRNLQFKFGPQVNFIVGQNGSGKSAVLVALAVGLGAKPSFTNRAMKIGDLITTGASSATIVIRIRNRGSEAYKPELYGPSIVVERRLTREGPNTYKIKDHTEKRVVAKTANELSLILEQFNIQVNNPCALLMQDTSRQFLTKASPKDMYKFFLVATQLEQMENDFKLINEQLETMKSTLTKKSKMLPELKKKLDEYEHEYRELNTLRDLEKRLEELKQQMAWAYVQEAEDAVAETEKEMQLAERQIEKMKKGEEEYNTNVTRLKADLENKNALINEQTSKIQTLTHERLEIDKQMKDLKTEVARRQANQKELGKKIDMLNTRRKRYEQHINEEKKKATKDKEAEREQREKQLKRKRDELEEINEAMFRMKSQKIEIEQNSSTLTDQYDKFKQQEEYKRNQKNHYERNFRNFENQKKDVLRAYGENTQKLIDTFNRNANRFSGGHAPLGPVGRLLKVKEEQYATAVEACTITHLTSYVIGDPQRDKRTAEELARSIGVREGVPLRAAKFNREEYSRSELRLPDQDFTCMLDVIECKGYPMITNMLIDQAQVESVIIFPEAKAARQVMFSKNPPRNTKEAYAFDGTKLFNKNGTQNFVPFRGQRKFISVDVDSQMRALQEQIRGLDNELKGMSEEGRRFEREKNQQKSELEQLRRTFMSKQVNAGSLEKEIQEIESFKEEPTADISELENNLQECLDEIEKLQQEVDTAQESVSEALQQTKPFQIQADQKNKEIEKLTRECEKMESGITATASKLREATTKMESTKKVIDDLKIRLSGLEDQREQQISNLKVTTAKAQQFCDRVDVGNKRCDIIDKEIYAVQKRIEKEKAGRKKSPQEITRQYKETKIKYGNIENTVNKLEALRVRLSDNLKERIKRWEKSKQSIAKRTMLLFNANLSQKGFSGKINFDHKARTLDISVKLDTMRPEKQQHEVNDTKALSGGERSYSTVSLLLALWEAMENPFRAMDEFDVFMDSVNRNISIQLLIEAASDKPNRQFIFITPHDSSMIDTNVKVRVHRMRPPERNQSTLSFASQSQQ